MANESFPPVTPERRARIAEIGRELAPAANRLTAASADHPAIRTLNIAVLNASYAIAQLLAENETLELRRQYGADIIADMQLEAEAQQKAPR